MKERREVSSSLDDAAFVAGQFIYKLGEVQEREFEKLWEQVVSKGWMRGFGSEENAKGVLWDYCFNNFNDKDENGFLQSLSEHCDADWMPKGD